MPDPHQSGSTSADLEFTHLPDFLVLGAMKAGTTTLYHDLRSQPAITLPDKESNALLGDRPGDALRKLFPSATAGNLRGEICPDYTKPGIDIRAAAKAEQVYGESSAPAPKLIYLVREPIARLRSHHYFVSSQFGEANPGDMSADLEHSLDRFPELIGTSCYASRIQPWIDAFGTDTLLIVRFEDYIANRSSTIVELADFLGMKKVPQNLVDDARIHNPSASRPVATPGWRRIMVHPFYRRCLRPLLPLQLRDRLRSLFLPRPPSPPPAPRPDTLTRLVEHLRPEVEAISALAGRPANCPLWDLDSVREEILYSGQHAS